MGEALTENVSQYTGLTVVEALTEKVTVGTHV